MENTVVNAPSKRALAKATSIALLVALILLFTAVLPAEYGFDPLKTGKALGHAYGGGSQFFSMWVVGDKKPA